MNKKILLWIFVLISLISFSYATSLDYDTLLHAYTFNETSGLLIDQIGNLNGTPRNIDYQQTSTFPYSYLFNSATDELRINNSGTLNYMKYEGFSILFRMNASTSYSSALSFPISKGGAGGYELDVRYRSDQTPSKLEFLISNTVGATVCDLSGDAITNLAKGVETGIQIIIKNGSIGNGWCAIYFEGVLKKNASFIGNPTNAALDLYFGSRAGGNDYYGTLDEVRIYNKTLNASEIVYNNNNKYIPKPSPPNITSNNTDGVYFSFDGITVTGTKIKNWINNSNNGTKKGTNQPQQITTGVLQEAVSFDGTDDYIKTANNPDMQNNISFFTWVNCSPTSNDEYISMHYDNSGDDSGWFMYIDNLNGDTVTLQVYTAGGYNKLQNFINYDICDNSWHHIGFTSDGTSIKGYLNSIINYSIGYPSLNLSDNPLYLGVKTVDGAGASLSNYYSGGMDEVLYSNIALNQSQITDLYSQTMHEYAVSNPNITIVSPIDNDHSNNNLSVTFNVTDPDGYDTDCSLYVNGTLKDSATSIPYDSVLIFNASLAADGNYTWYVSCTDGRNTTNTTPRSYIFDTINPDVTWTYPVQGSDNVVYSNFSVNINVEDQYLYRVLMNITGQNGSSIYSNYSGDIDQINYNFTDLIPITDFPYGLYTVEVSATDDHTYGKLKHLTMSQPSDSIIKFMDNDLELLVSFDTYNGNNIKKLNPLDIRTRVDEVKLSEKLAKDNIKLLNPIKEDYLTEYKFNYDFTVDKKGDYIAIKLELKNGEFNKRNNNKYAAHFIYGDKYYIDFEDAEQIKVNGITTNATIEVISYSENTISIKIDTPGKFEAGDYIEIDPVTGGLNTITETVTFLYQSTPEMDSVTLTPTTPSPGNNIYGVCVGSDADNDGLVYTYNWSVNGNVVKSIMYQDNVTSATATAPANLANVLDNNWTSYTTSSLHGSQLIYKKPSNVTAATWMVKDTDGQTNLTIPQSCFDYNSTYMKFSISVISVGTPKVKWYCYNSTSVIKLLESSGNEVYEEAIVWDVRTDFGVLESNYTASGDLIDLSCRVYDHYNYSTWMSSSLNINYTYNITFRDEISHNLITDLITVQFLSDDYIYNFSTTSGYLFTGNLNYSVYTIRYSSPNQTYLREYIIDLTNDSINQLTFYMINSTDGTTINIKVYEENTLVTVSGAIITVLRYQSDGTYETIGMYTTDTNGNAYFDMQEAKEYYKMYVDYPYGDRQLMTDRFYIRSNTINLYIDLIESVAEVFFQENGIDAAISYNEVSKEFTVDWSDPATSATQYCFYIKKYGFYEKTIINSSCSTSPVSAITLGGLYENTTYYAVLTALINGDERIISTGWQTLNADNLPASRFGVVMSAIIVIMVGFIAPISALTMVLASMGLIFSKYFGILVIEWAYLFGIFTIALITSLIIRLKG